MSRILTAMDCHLLINAISAEMTGQQPTIQAQDTSGFVSVGESILKQGKEDTLNAISIVLGRTFMAVRPYEAKLKIINALNSGLYTNRLRKISYYSRESQASGAFNTHAYYTNHAMGYDNGTNSGSSVPSMWEQNQPVPLELNFAGRSVWDESSTVYEVQLQTAFRSEEDFADFVEGILTEKGNDIETHKEAFNRMTLLNYMAGIYDLNSYNGGAAIDMTAEFNTKYGTTYTTSQILHGHFKEFLEVFVATIKKVSDLLTNRSLKWHVSPTKTIDNVNYYLLRHTPKSKQRLIMYRPFWTDAEARVMPEIFNDQYLKPEAYEGVDYWQNENDPSAIDLVPAVPNVPSFTAQTNGNRVQLSTVLGVLYDEDALMVDYQLDSVDSTPVEARKRYRNIWWHFAKNSINDFTENGVLFYMANDPET